MWREAAVLTAAAGLASLARSEYEKKHFSVEAVQVVSRKLRRDRRLVFLSDLHSNEFGPGNRELTAAIFRIRPDAVLVGGDMMVTRDNGRGDTCVPLALIRELSARLPVYCGNGNHENRMAWRRPICGNLYEEYRDALISMGVIYLDDKSAPLGEDILISGVDLDPVYYRRALFRPLPTMGEDYLNKKLGGGAGGRDWDKFSILLAHSPLYFERYAAWGADLTLSGHFHGGTVRLPLLGGVMTPQYQFFLPWCAGDFDMGGRRMVVSRGLGTHSVNIRFNNKPQLVVIELKCAGNKKNSLQEAGNFSRWGRRCKEL